MATIFDISNKRWLDEQEAIIYTSLCRDTLRELRNERKIPFRNIGKKIIYEKKHLDAFFEKIKFTNPLN
jgi:hypothetical protein